VSEPQQPGPSGVGAGEEESVPAAEQALEAVPAASDSLSTLLERARRGDLEAVRSLLAEHRDGLFGIAWSYLGDRDEAIDACQEALTKALANARRFDPSQPVSAWLARIVRNVCLDRLRRLKYRRHASLDERREAGLPDPSGQGPGPEQLLLGRELRAKIREAMATLRPEEREVLFLRETLEWPYARIEAFLDLAHGTVASLIHRARLRLRDRLSEYIEPAAEAAAGEER
jgi:RNA polymerase sigma-70 factor (ECF subfamily)